jgi:hypothetical protein
MSQVLDGISFTNFPADRPWAGNINSKIFLSAHRGQHAGAILVGQVFFVQPGLAESRIEAFLERIYIAELSTKMAIFVVSIFEVTLFGFGILGPSQLPDSLYFLLTNHLFGPILLSFLNKRHILSIQD